MYPFPSAACQSQRRKRAVVLFFSQCQESPPCLLRSEHIQYSCKKCFTCLPECPAVLLSSVIKLLVLTFLRDLAPPSLSITDGLNLPLNAEKVIKTIQWATELKNTTESGTEEKHWSFQVYRPSPCALSALFSPAGDNTGFERSVNKVLVLQWTMSSYSPPFESCTHNALSTEKQ